jgi:hypothetical protein
MSMYMIVYNRSLSKVVAACDTGRALESLGASQHTKDSFMHIAPSAKPASATVLAIFAIWKRLTWKNNVYYATRH